ncbi:reverse transcriptase domain-containing protein [Tanacetum coccineum]|uniref:Reverse transcriptase domain-containing protein n=1 Tax=Tanacetum coccineum TaxID=301880 RepID=A0ABQ5G7M7_9ASTR
MPFGLRNAGATYQRLVDKAFHKKIGINLEVYVDNIVIKSRTEEEIVRDIEETFKTQREINMKLNLKKCTFGVEEGMFLGFTVNTKGLKTTKAEEAFKQMKQLISKLPMLTAPMEKEELIVYLAAAKETVSAVLMTEREAKQMPIYFVSRALRGLEINYTSMEKLVLGLVGSGAGSYSQTLEGMEFTYDHKVRFDDYKTNEAIQSFDYRVPRSENKKADALSKIASTSFAHLSKQVLVEELKEKSISTTEVLTIIEEEGDTWMALIFKYITEETMPTEVQKARAVRRKSQRFAVHDPLWQKALRIGYYWPTMHEDTRALIRACQDCQVHKHVPRNPQQKLTPITSPWPIYKLAIDIAGPFPEGPGKVKFLIVALDYFIKWIEAKPVTTITGNQVKKFVWDNIVCRFGLLGEIISDNAKVVRDDPFKDWCEKLCIRQHFASAKHPQTNGLVERANRSLGEGIKARLDTPFSLTYGTEAVILAEIGMPTLRTAEVDLVRNNEALEINLDLLEEKREQAAIPEARSKAKMEKYYKSKVRSTSFKPGDLVYRINDASRTEDTGKLGPKWEGPYQVTEALGKGTYKLRDRDGKQLPRTWNISNLKMCYIQKR